MFLSLTNKNNNFPDNLQIDMSIYTNNVDSNELGFTINMKVLQKNQSSFDLIYIGTFFKHTKKLLVAQKGSLDYKDQFFLHGKILVPNLFTEFILPQLNLN